MSDKENKKVGILDNLLVKLIISIAIGIVVGNFVGQGAIGVISTIKFVLSNFINYVVPLIILGFITPAIVSLNQQAGKVLSVTLIICYLSSVGAALFAFLSGKLIIPNLNIVSSTAGGKELPELLFQMDIPPIMPVMTALISAILFGLAVVWTKADKWADLLKQFNDIVLFIVEKVVIKVLPLYIATTFAELAYEGVILQQFPVFLKIILIVILGHFIWLALLYGLGGAFSKTNPMEVLKHYPPAYMTAVGTMSSAATLSVALKSASKAKTLDPKIRDFVVSLCSNTHLCGSVLTETFFVMVVSQILYGKLPSTGQMVLFILLLGIFAIGAPGVPGGTVMASLGLITSILGFDSTGTALMLSIFALQDSFGTACNITGDGAIALMVTGIMDKVPGRNGNPEYIPEEESL